MRPSRYAAGLVAMGAAATAVQFVRARNGYPWFGDLDPSGHFGDSARPAVDLLLLGDSTCTGSGLDVPEDIWVRQLLPQLTERYHVRLVSVAAGGARVADVLRDQLPAVEGQQWDVAFVSVGANDALRAPSMALVTAQLGPVVDRLLEHSRVVLLAGIGDMGSSPRMLQPFDAVMRFRSWRLDRGHRRVAARRDRVRKVDMWADTGLWRSGADLWAADRFHPNRNGHALWAATIYPALDAAIAQAVAAR